VTPERALPVQADGESAGETPVTLSVEPRSLSVLVAPRPNPLFTSSLAEA
jgi:diacylglycerol kinase family enzyme